MTNAWNEIADGRDYIGTENGKPAYVYARSATGNEESFRRQLAACDKFATANDYRIDAKNYFEEIVNGADIPPTLNRLLFEIKHDGDIIICATANRLGRDLSNFEFILSLAKSLGVKFLFADEISDEQTKTIIRAVIGEAETNALKHRIAEGRRLAAERRKSQAE